MSPSVRRVYLAKWKPILEEYEKVRSKRSTLFKTVKALIEAHRVTKKDLYKYYHRWVANGRQDESLLPKKRGPRFRTRRVLKEKERQIMKAYRRLGAPSYELVELFRPYYGAQTPSVRTIDRIKARYPLNEKQKAEIKRYEKLYPGELAHLDSYYLPKALTPKGKKSYVVALVDDCTRLAYAEVVETLQALPTSYFVARAFSWFKLRYGFHFDTLMTDNGVEFKGNDQHPVEYFLSQINVRHIYTPFYHPQPNGKVEAFFKILQNELVRAHPWENLEEFKAQLGGYIFDYNHQRRHGGIDYLTPYEKLEKVTELLT